MSKFLYDSNAPSIAGFLISIKTSDDAHRTIAIITDNFSSPHKSVLVRQKAKELDISRLASAIISKSKFN